MDLLAFFSPAVTVAGTVSRWTSFWNCENEVLVFSYSDGFGGYAVTSTVSSTRSATIWPAGV